MPNYKSCKFLSCPSKSHLHREKKFYPFVKPWLDHEKCLRWISASGRKDLTPVFIDKYSYVCEDHFVNGVPSAENPDPLPYDIVERVIYKEQHTDENPDVSDDPPEHGDENPCARENYGAPFTENLDPLQHHFLASTVDSLEQANSPVRLFYPGNISSGRQTALGLKKKAVSPKKASKINQAPYRVPVSKPKVTDVNNDVKETVSCGIPGPLTEDVNSPVQSTSDDLPQTDNASSFGPSGADGVSPMAHTRSIYSLQRKRFDDFVMDVVENDSDERSVRDTSADIREKNDVFEKAGKCFVQSQPMSRAYVNKLIAAGKLSKWRAVTTEGQTATVEGHNDNSGKVRKKSRVKTINSGGQITIVKYDDKDDNV